MSELLTRAGALFLAPAQAPPRAAVTAPPADLVVVLAPLDSLLAASGAAAAALRTRTVLVLLPEPLAGPAPALPAAHALTRRLIAREVPAVAAGRTVRVGLPAIPETGVREAWRAIGAAAGTPTVVALPGRSEALDELLAHADQILLAVLEDDDLTALALASLTSLGPSVARITTPSGIVARRLAALGLHRSQRGPHEVMA